jgi:hypothetical protein
MGGAFREPARRLAAALRALALACAGVLPAASVAVAAPQSFESPEAAMEAFGDAVATSDEAGLRRMLGSDVRALIPPVGAEDRQRFLAAWSESHAIQRAGEAAAYVTAGRDGWTLPIPLVKTPAGWRFDTRAGVEEMRIRRIGRNELAVMQTLLAIRDAQQEYAAEYRDGDTVAKYAAKLRSSPGRRDGLYWPTAEGEKASPLGPALAKATPRREGTEGYHGYHYKLLTAQGPNAPGGALDYRVRGRLFGGFAVIAWPVRYGDTGLMSFMVSHDGQLYERDLGPDSATRALATSRFDPGPGWRKVSP